MNTLGTDRITVTLPSRYLCCLSKRVMKHPVVLSGEPATNYDRDSLAHYVSRNGWKSPASGNPFVPTDIVSCPSLEAEIGVQFWQLYQPDGVRPPVQVDLTGETVDLITGSPPICTATDGTQALGNTGTKAFPAADSLSIRGRGNSCNYYRKQPSSNAAVTFPSEYQHDSGNAGASLLGLNHVATNPLMTTAAATVAAAPACPQPNLTHPPSRKRVSSVSGWRRVECPREEPGDAAGCSGRPSKVARLPQQGAPECDQEANLTAATQRMMTLAADGQQKSNQGVGAGEEVTGAKLPGSWNTAPMSWGTAMSPSVAGLAVTATGCGTEPAANCVAPAANAIVTAAAAAPSPVGAAMAPPAVAVPAEPVTMTHVSNLCTSRPVLLIDRVEDCPARGEGDPGIHETAASAAPRPEQLGTAAVGCAATGVADSRRREVAQVTNHDGAASRAVSGAAGSERSPEEGSTATASQAAAALLPPAVTAPAGARGGSGSLSAQQQRRCSLRFPAGAGPVVRAAMLRDWEVKQREKEEPVARRILSLAARVAEYHKLQARVGRRAMLLRDELDASPWLLPQNPVPIV